MYHLGRSADLYVAAGSVSWAFHWSQFLYHLAPTLSWLLAGLGAVSIVNIGPIGEALAHRIRHGTQDPAVLQDELAALRAELARLSERLDYA
jgi:hypothetical protein